MPEYPVRTIFNGTLHCVAPGCANHRLLLNEVEAPISPRFAASPSDLCNWHHAQFPRVLNDLVRLWGTLEESLIRRPNGQKNDRVQTSDVGDVSSMWNPAVAAVLYELNDWTKFLVRTILGERPVPDQYFTTDEQGTTTTTYSHGLSIFVPGRQALAGIAKWHGRWLSGYPSLGPALLDDALAHRRASLRALDTAPVVRVHLKGPSVRCAHVIEESEWGEVICEAPLVGIIREPDSKLPSAILCTANPGHPQLSRDQWMDHDVYAH
jgi:hypothetical protein